MNCKILRIYYIYKTRTVHSLSIYLCAEPAKGRGSLYKRKTPHEPRKKITNPKGGGFDHSPPPLSHVGLSQHPESLPAPNDENNSNRAFG